MGGRQAGILPDPQIDSLVVGTPGATVSSLEAPGWAGHPEVLTCAPETAELGTRQSWESGLHSQKLRGRWGPRRPWPFHSMLGKVLGGLPPTERALGQLPAPLCPAVSSVKPGRPEGETRAP